MRILTVSTLDYGGGAEKIARDLVDGYRNRGHESWLAVGRRRLADGDSLAIPEARDYRPRNPDAPPPTPVDAILRGHAEGGEDFDFPGSWDLLDLPPAPPELVHAHNLHGWYFDLRALPWISRRVPTLLTLHDAWLTSGHCAHSFGCERWRSGCGACPDLTIYPPLRADGTAANWRRKRDIYAASRLFVATPSRWLMDRVDASMLMPGVVDRRVIPNGIDLSVFHPRNKADVRRALGLPVEATVLLFTANAVRSNPWKDYASTRAAVERLASDSAPGRPLILLNLGEQAPPERIGHAHVLFVPYQTEPAHVAAFYQAADIYLHMTRADTFPNVVLEALCCGTPVAATAVGGIPEQIRSLLPWADGPGHDAGQATGILVGPGDAEAMAQGLRRLLDAPALMQRLGENAARDGRERFDASRMIADYADWAEEITARSMDSVTTSGGNGTRKRIGVADHYASRFLAGEAEALKGRGLLVGEVPAGLAISGVERLHDPALFCRLPDSAYDLVLLTDALGSVADPRAVLEEAWRALKPGGTLLATLPGLRSVERDGHAAEGCAARFTADSAARLFAGLPGSRLKIQGFGNRDTVIAALDDVPATGLLAETLQIQDPRFPVIVAVKAVRRRAATVHTRHAGGPPVILAYRRVAELTADPLGMAISPERFAAHLEVIRRVGRPMPLDELIAALDRGQAPAGAVALTIDGGDDGVTALAGPLLTRYEAPATLIVAPARLGREEEFWWDELERLLLSPGRLPDALVLQNGGGSERIHLGLSADWSEEEARRHAGWTLHGAAPPTARHILYQRLVDWLERVADDEERSRTLDALRGWAGSPRVARPGRRPLRPDELIAFADNPLIDIAMSIADSRPFTRQSPTDQADRIVRERRRLEEVLGWPVAGFAYPAATTGKAGGEAPAMESRALLRNIGFQWACTLQPDRIGTATERFALPRVRMGNWSDERLEALLTGGP